MVGAFFNMWQQLIARVQRTVARGWVSARPVLRRAGVYTLAFVRGPVRAVLQTLAALLFLFLEWGWEPLATALSGLLQYFGFKRLSAWIAGLPPYGALAIFAVPAICLIPIKLFAVYLFASGHPIAGVLLIIGAKLVGTAVVARVYILTQPQLMQISWFKNFHDRFMAWKDRMYAGIRASDAWRQGRIVRVEVKRAVNRTWIALRPQRAWAVAQARIVRTWFAGVGKQPR